MDVTLQHLSGVSEMVSALISDKVDVITFTVYLELEAISQGEELTFSL